MDRSERKQGSRLTALLSCCALALVLTAAPGFGPFAGDGWDGAALAKSENGGGNGNGGNGGNNGKGGEKGNKGKSSSAKGKSAKAAATEDGTLTPSQKGKWNAMNASPQALAAHIANGNFNGTVGALAQLNLAAKAASGAALSAEEMAALEGMVNTDGIEISDEDVVDALNEAATKAGVDASWSVTEEGIGCEGDGCPGDDEVEGTIDGARSGLELQEAYDQFLDDSKARIAAESNKPLSADELEQLFDEMGDRWGVDITPEEPAPDASAAEGEAETPPAEEGA